MHAFLVIPAFKLEGVEIEIKMLFIFCAVNNTARKVCFLSPFSKLY